MTERKRRYPRVGELSREARAALKTDRMHSEVAVVWHEGGPEEIFCGDNWCKGECGLPALVMPGWHPGQVLKASGSQVACGAVMQSLRVQWRGPLVEVPEEHREDFLERWYL